MQKMRSEQLKKDKLEEEKQAKGIGGNFMDAVFEEKKHISYDKRARNDKQVEAIKKKLDQGDTQRKLEQEEKAIENYFRE